MGLTASRTLITMKSKYSFKTWLPLVTDWLGFKGESNDIKSLWGPLWSKLNKNSNRILVQLMVENISYL